MHHVLLMQWQSLVLKSVFIRWASTSRSTHGTVRRGDCVTYEIPGGIDETSLELSFDTTYHPTLA